MRACFICVENLRALQLELQRAAKAGLYWVTSRPEKEGGRGVEWEEEEDLIYARGRSIGGVWHSQS